MQRLAQVLLVVLPLGGLLLLGGLVLHDRWAGSR